jgi:hypothetical protein
LQDGFVNVLLDLAERLEWEATWLDDDMITRSALSDAQWQKIESGLEALSMACEVVINNNVTLPEIQVQVTGGDSMTTNCFPFPMPEPVKPDGTPIETVCLPVDPENPSGEYPVEVVDEANLIPPTGWPDWNTFVDNKCRAANYMVDALIGAVNAIDEAENRTSILLHIVQLFLQFAPESLQRTSAWNKVLKWADALIAFVGDVEEIWDWAQTAVAKVEELRNEIVCIIYSSPDVVTAAAAVAVATADELTASMVAAGVDGNNQALVIEFWETLVNDIVPRAYDYDWVLSIPDGYQAPYNCSACGGGGLGGDWVLVPVTYESVVVFGGDGGVTDHAITNLGAYIRLSALCDSPGDNARFVARFSCPEAAGMNVYGWHLDTDNLVNISSAGVHTYNSGGDTHLTECSNQNTPPVPQWCVREDVATFELETGISTNVGAACPPPVFLADGTEFYDLNMQQICTISGAASTDRKLFLICRTNV